MEHLLEYRHGIFLAVGIILAIGTAFAASMTLRKAISDAVSREPDHIEETEEMMQENIATSCRRSDEEWRCVLTAEQFRVMRRKGTEPPFSSRFAELKDNGLFRCAACGNPLFHSRTKFDSGTGWPSFYAPVDTSSIDTKADMSHGMRRIEVLCGRCEGHLGHVFNDGPEPTGERYCINAVVLQFVPDKN